MEKEQHTVSRISGSYNKSSPSSSKLGLPGSHEVELAGLVFVSVPLIIAFGGRANLSAFGRRQTKIGLSTGRTELSFCRRGESFLFAAQKQLLAVPLSLY